MQFNLRILKAIILEMTLAISNMKEKSKIDLLIKAVTLIILFILMVTRAETLKLLIIYQTLVSLTNLKAKVESQQSWVH